MAKQCSMRLSIVLVCLVQIVVLAHAALTAPSGARIIATNFSAQLSSTTLSSVFASLSEEKPYMVQVADNVIGSSLKRLWTDHGLHHRRHVFAPGDVYLVRMHVASAAALSIDHRVSLVSTLQQHHKVSGLYTHASSDTRSQSDLHHRCMEHQQIRRFGFSSLNVSADMCDQPFVRARRFANSTHPPLNGQDIVVMCDAAFNDDAHHAVSMMHRWSQDAQLKKLVDFQVHHSTNRTATTPSSLTFRIPEQDDFCAILRKIADDDDAIAVEVRPQYVVLNNHASATAQSSTGGVISRENAEVWKHGIMGQGEVVGIGDTGIDVDSCYFREKSTSTRQIDGCNMSNRKIVCYHTHRGARYGDDAYAFGGGHGTHTAATIAGFHDVSSRTNGEDVTFEDIIRHPQFMNGVAPRARLAVDDIGSGGGFVLIPFDVDSFFGRFYESAGVRIHSNSWGCTARPGGERFCNMYDSSAREMDRFMWEHKDFLMVFAAGNGGDTGIVDGPYQDGFYTTGSPATFKNGVAVGATQRQDSNANCVGGSDGVQQCSHDNLYAGSSRGPTFDGRVKPDVVFPGEAIGSAMSSGNPIDFSEGNCGGNASGTQAAFYSGTSMSCPGISGSLALIRQYYKQRKSSSMFRSRFFKVSRDNHGPSAALMKATLLNSARSLRGEYTYRTSTFAGRSTNKVQDASNPRYLEGFGRPNLANVLIFNENATSDQTSLTKSLFTFDRHQLTNGAQPHVFSFRVAKGAALKATLVYTDPPGPLRSVFDTGPVLVNNLDLVANFSRNDSSLSHASHRSVNELLVSKSSVDNVEQIPSVSTQPLLFKRQGRFEIRVVPVRIVESQPYALVVSGSGVSFIRRRSTRDNWKPEWTRQHASRMSLLKRKGKVSKLGILLISVLVVCVLILVCGGPVILCCINRVLERKSRQ